MSCLACLKDLMLAVTRSLHLLEKPTGEHFSAASTFVLTVVLSRLSPAIRDMLDNLMALHTSSKMIAHVRAVGGRVRKDPIDTIHPLVRVHPVTGERCLFVNGEFLTKIIGLKEPEFKMLTEFLLNHIMMG